MNQRLYAFLLRRLLGPYLDYRSKEILHKSIEVSFEEGKFSLQDVELSSNYLNSLELDIFRVCKARIGKINIILSLEDIRTGVDDLDDNELDDNEDNKNDTGNCNYDNQDDDEGDEIECNNSNSSSLWKIFKLGTLAVMGQPSCLVAKVEISDVYIEVESRPPCNVKNQKKPKKTPTGTAEQSQSETDQSVSMLSSYVEAALASLRLSLKVTNIHTRIVGFSSRFVELRVSSISYRDAGGPIIPNKDQPENVSSYETLLNKVIQFSRITIVAGETKEGLQTPLASPVASMDGMGEVCLRAVEYTEIDKPEKQLQHDIQIKIHHELKLSFDETSLSRIQEVARGFTEGRETEEEEVNDKLQSEEEREGKEEEFDLADIHTMDGMMKKYQQARYLAECNEVRGGVLIPTNAYETNDNKEATPNADDSISFDIFFDANDKSFNHYKSILKESTCSYDEASSSFFHTKLKLHAIGGGLKVHFRKGNNIVADPAPNDEYIFLTFNDLNATSSISTLVSHHNIHISHLEIDDSYVDNVLTDKGFLTKRTKIGRVLRFTHTESDGIKNEPNNFLLQAPCMSIHVTSKKESHKKFSTALDINFEPLEVTYRQSTVSKMIQLAQQLQDEDHICEKQVMQNGGPEEQTMSLLCNCDSVAIKIPCSSPLPLNTISPSFGFNIEHISLKVERTKAIHPETLKIGDDTIVGLECNYILCYALSTTQNHVGRVNQQMKRLDILALTGLADVDPCIPIELEYRKSSPCNSFPIFPIISSFKARQVEKGEDIEIDHLLSERLDKDICLDVRNSLKGQDPQDVMRKTASDCKSILRMHVPMCTGDLSTSEISMLFEMINGILPQSEGDAPKKQTIPSDSGDSLNLDLSIDRMLFAIHDDICSTSIKKSDRNCKICRWNSQILRMDRFEMNSVIDNGFRQLRICTHDINIIEAADLIDDSDRMTSEFSSVEKRINNLKLRTRRNTNTLAVPIFYRSQLFTPISEENPSILFDMVIPENNANSSICCRNFYLTIYNMTFRYDIESEWIERFQKVLESFPTNESPSIKEPTKKSDLEKDFLAKVFVSMADCNVDYTSPTSFRTPSRSIMRIGDIRICSNIVQPATRVRAFSISLGDMSIFLCPARYAHNFENLYLSEAKILMKPDELNISSSLQKVLTSIPNVVTARREAVFRHMKFRTILILDSLETVVALSNSINQSLLTDPRVTMSFSFGELCLYACKDSFENFLGTIGEAQKKLTAIDNEGLAKLRSKTFIPCKSEKSKKISDHFLLQKGGIEKPKIKGKSRSSKIKNRIKKMITKSSAQERIMGMNETKTDPIRESSSHKQIDKIEDFFLDGYDWTAVDQCSKYSTVSIPEDKEQTACWYTDTAKSSPADCSIKNQNLDMGQTILPPKSIANVIPHHFPLQIVSNPLACDGGLSAAKFAQTKTAPVIQNRVLVHDLAVKVRLYDGYDWPELISAEKLRALRNGGTNGAGIKIECNDGEVGEGKKKQVTDTKSRLMNELLVGVSGDISTFEDCPLPEEKVASLLKDSDIRRLSRQTNRYLQFSASGFHVKMDSYAECSEHLLASCIDISVMDLFLVETIGKRTPVKMIGEWVNDREHPRDTNVGFAMLKMVTWHAACRVTSNNTVVNDEAEAILKFLPVRCILNQQALGFAKSFFNSDVVDESKNDFTDNLHSIPPPLFKVFHTTSCKLKIDYNPQKLDLDALKNGSVVELLNLSPIDGMVFILDQVDVENKVGFGDVTGILVERWMQNIKANHMLKFLTNARPFEPLSSIGGGVADLVVLPWDAYKNGDNMKKAVRSSLKSLAGTLTYEALTTTSKLTEYIAGEIARTAAAPVTSRISSAQIPPRPIQTPKRVGDTADYAFESIARGVEAANFKVVIVPFREYKKNGATGAMTSILKGIPLAVAAPMSGATEALSYTLLGVRNQFLPEIRKEEEANERGLYLNCS